MHKRLRPEKRGEGDLAKNLERLWNRDEGISGERVSLTTLARNIGIPQPVLFKIYTGEIVEPKDRTLIPIAKYFDVTISQLRGHATIKETQLTSAKARLMARKIDALPPRAQRAINELIEEMLAYQQSRRTG